MLLDVAIMPITPLSGLSGIRGAVLPVLTLIEPDVFVSGDEMRASLIVEKLFDAQA